MIGRPARRRMVPCVVLRSHPAGGIDGSPMQGRGGVLDAVSGPESAHVVALGPNLPDRPEIRADGLRTTKGEQRGTRWRVVDLGGSSMLGQRLPAAVVEHLRLVPDTSY